MNWRSLRLAVTAAARRSVADPGGVAVAVGFYALVTVVLATLWRTAAGANGGQVVGYTAAALTWYVATSEAATCALNIRLIEDIGTDIGSGSIAVEMLRPASVLAVRVASEVGRALPRLAACVAAGSVIAVVTVGGPPSAAGAALAVPALLLAITANLLAQHAFAGAAFWIRDARSAWFLYQKVVFVVGGMLLPLEVLPTGFETVAKALPFMAMAYAPARLASGHVEPLLLVAQLGWVAVLALAAMGVFAAGERRLQVVGG